MEETKESPVNSLVKKLNIIENLRDKLVHVKWSQESLRLLERVVFDTLVLAQRHGFVAVSDSAAQVQLQIRNCLVTEVFSRCEGRERLLYLLDDLKQKPPFGSAPSVHGERPLDGIGAGNEILLIDNGDLKTLADKLQHYGYRIKRINSLDRARDFLIKRSPPAVILDTDCGKEPLAGIRMVGRLRERFGLLNMPVIFVSERGDLDARMEAAEIGGLGYFLKPVKVSALVERLNECLHQKSLRGYRVLVVGEDGAGCRQLASTLDAKGVITQILLHPRQVFHAMNRFKPDLMMLDLEMGETDGVVLARALRQHEACEGLPVLLLVSQEKLGQHLAMVDNGEGDFLVKPLSSEVLLAVVTHRLRKARAFLQRLSRIGYRDQVTELGNRHYFIDHLKRVLDADDLNQPRVALMLITVDNLRQMEAMDVNVADEVLSQMAIRLHSVVKSQVEGQSEVARFGAAIFAVSLNTDDSKLLLELARSVQASLNRGPYLVNEARVTPQTSVGIGMASGVNDNYLTLIQQANLACIMARGGGGDRIRVHSQPTDYDEKVSCQLKLLQRVREAAEQQRMSLVFQPIVDLKRDGIERYEVLLRMLDSDGHELLPETVFAVTQNQSLGVFLERWVIANSLRMLQERRAAQRTTRLFLNVSSTILQDGTFMDWLHRKLVETGALPGELIFEVKETTIWSQLEQWQKFAPDVKGLGCSFAVEHFGSGTDSELLLDQLPVDYVKFDAQLIQAWGARRKNFFRDIVRKCNKRKIRPIVTGVEDMATLQTIISSGASYAQGYFLKRPDEDMEYAFA
jgi:diguanylate cyclase (GGDEF)-like protein